MAYEFHRYRKCSHANGMGHQWFMDMFGRLEDYGFTNTFAETAAEAGLSAEESASDLAQAISKKAQLESTRRKPRGD